MKRLRLGGIEVWRRQGQGPVDLLNVIRLQSMPRSEKSIAVSTYFMSPVLMEGAYTRLGVMQHWQGLGARYGSGLFF